MSEDFWVGQFCTTHPAQTHNDRLWLTYLLYYFTEEGCES